MRTLRGRILFTASLVLAVFLGGAGMLLDRAFRQSALDGVEDRLRGRVFMLIGAADFDVGPLDELIGGLPDPALLTPGSGHYARIVALDSNAAWSSRSMLGVELNAPPSPAVGTWRLGRVAGSNGEDLFALTYGILWEGVGDSAPRRFTIEAYENDALYRATVSHFRRSLWFWFAALSVALLFVQALNLSRSLHPLARVGEEVRAIEAGHQEQLLGSYPSELTTLTRSLNKLLHHNRDSLRRYRNALGDLAHSIKTPLAVLRNELERGAPDLDARRTMLEHVERLDHTVQYHLQRASTLGSRLLSPPCALAPAVERIVETLRKVYAERDIVIETALEAGATFPGDEGDLMEIVGNLADNACKWATGCVLVEARTQHAADGIRRVLVQVHDDGPGIPAGQIERLMQRGARLDESVEGHGIGLAVVRDMVEGAYHGRLTLASTGQGTIASVELPWS